MGELLRRKLEALGYGEHDKLVFDESLASRLVSDLIQASQAGESLRKKASDTALQLELANDKVEVLTRETRRLTTENNHLHTKLIAAADKLDRFERTTQQVHRRLEQRVSEAVSQQKATAARCEALQRERDGLSQHALSPGSHEACNGLTGHAASRGKRSPPPLQNGLPTFDVLNTTFDSRVAELEKIVFDRTADIELVKEEVNVAEAAVRRRDEEIARLAAQLEASRPAEADALARRAQMQAESILQLHTRLEEAGAQLAAVSATAERVAAAEAAAQQAETDRKAAERRTAQAVADNAAIAAEVGQMRAALSRLQEEHDKAAQQRGRQASPHKTPLGAKTPFKRIGGPPHAKSGRNGFTHNHDATAAKEAALQGTVQLLQSQAEEAAAARDAAAAERDALAAQLDAAAAEAAAAQRSLRQQLDAAWQDAANKSARVDDLERLLQEAQQAHAGSEAALRACQQQRDKLAHMPQNNHQQQQNQQRADTHKLQQQVETLQAELAAARQAVQNAQAEVASLRRAGEEGEAAVFRLHEVQLQLDDARASLQALQQQTPRFDSRRQQQQLGLHASNVAGANNDEDGGDGPRPQQLPHCFRQRASRRPEASAAAAAADADALQAARQQLAAQGRQLAKQEEELERLQQQATNAQAAARQARQQLHDAKGEAAAARESSKRAEAAQQQVQAQLAELRAQQEDDQAAARAAADGTAAAQEEAAEARRELEERIAKDLAGDAEAVQLQAKLKEADTQLRAARLREADQEAALESAQEAAKQSADQAAQLQQALAEASAERDQRQRELAATAGRTAALHQDIVRLEQHLDAAQRDAATAEHHAASLEAQLAELQLQLADARQAAERAAAQLSELQGAHAALQQEFGLVADDLTVMVRENQAMAREGSQAAGERDEWAAEARAARRAAATAEQLARSHAAELADARKAYQGLAGEARRLSTTVAAQEREAAAREGALTAAAEETASVQSALAEAQLHLQQAIADVQAYERQVEELTRALTSGDESQADAAKERAALLQQLHSAEQVRFEAERAREQAQRQLAAAEGRAGVLQTRIDDVLADNRALRHKAGLEEARAGQLEALVGSLRSAAYRAAADSQAHGSRAAGAESRSAQLQAELSQLKQHAAVAGVDADHLRSAAATPGPRPRATSEAGTATDPGTSAAADGDEAGSALEAGSAPEAGRSHAAVSGGWLRGPGGGATPDPGHLAPVNAGGSPRADAAAVVAVHDGSASPHYAVQRQQHPDEETKQLRQQLQAAEAEALALRAQLRQLRGDHEATCAELEEARAQVRELREAVRMAERAAASAASSQGGPGVDSSNRPSWEALGRAEAQKAALQRAADAAEQGVLAATAQLAECQAALAQQRKDKERLEQLLTRAQHAAEAAHCDATRANAAAADARAQLAARPAAPEAAAGGRTAAETGESDALLQAELDREHALRKQAEADFRELVQSVDSLQVATQPQQAQQQQQQQRQEEPTSPPHHRQSTSMSPASEAGDAASPSAASSEEQQQRRQRQQQLGQAQAEAARLAADNASLRGRLAKTHRLVGAMQDELARARNGILLHRSPSGDRLDASPLQRDDQRGPPELQRSPAGSQDPGTGAEAAREPSDHGATLDDRTHVLLHRSRQLTRSDDGVHA